MALQAEVFLYKPHHSCLFHPLPTSLSLSFPIPPFVPSIPFLFFILCSSFLLSFLLFLALSVVVSRSLSFSSSHIILSFFLFFVSHSLSLSPFLLCISFSLHPFFIYSFIFLASHLILSPSFKFLFFLHVSRIPSHILSSSFLHTFSPLNCLSSSFFSLSFPPFTYSLILLVPLLPFSLSHFPPSHILPLSSTSSLLPSFSHFLFLPLFSTFSRM